MRIFHYFLVTGLLIVGLAGCTRPSNVMSNSQMESFLEDMYLMEGSLDQDKPGLASADSMDYPYYSVLLQKHGITQDQFDSSMVWYVKNPTQFNRVYVNVVRELERRKKVESAAIKLQDSLDNINKWRTYHIWKLAREFDIASDSLLPVRFSVKDTNFRSMDKYRLKFRMRINSSDSLMQIRSAMFLFYDDGSKDSLDYITPADSVLRSYMLVLNYDKERQLDSLGGYLSLVYKNRQVSKSGQKTQKKRTFRVQIEDISLTREYQLKNDKK